MDLSAFEPRHRFLVGIDSDGCAFDTMELKHKECFIPQIIQHYGLQGVSKYAREVAEFINLYSRMRGINRFPGLVETLRMVRRRPEVIARQIPIEIPERLAGWVAAETKWSNPALEAQVRATGDPQLAAALAWSQAVNAAIDAMVEAVPPFPGVRESLAGLHSRADLLVVSATPTAALEKEWAANDIARYVHAICGQEVGSKKEILRVARHYAPQHVLMVGDALGDYQAALANQCLFYPICPGHEEVSWARFVDEGQTRFLAGTFAGDYQASLLAEFERYLPATPPWPLIDAAPVSSA